MELIIIEMENIFPVFLCLKPPFLTKILIGRIYAYDLIRNVRMSHTIGTAGQKSLEEVKKNLNQYVTKKSELTDLVLDFAKFANIIKINKADQTISSDYITLILEHNLVNALDKREAFTVNLVVTVVSKLAVRFREGWVPRHIIWSEMDKETYFGYSRGEHDYWIDQTVFRAKRLEHRRIYENSREVKSVRLSNLKK